LSNGYHRLCHTYPALWRLHVIHHTPVRLHTLREDAITCLYAFGAEWCMVTTPGAWGTSKVGLLAVRHRDHYRARRALRNIGFRIPRFMHRLARHFRSSIVSTTRADPKLGNSNFGVVFPVWGYGVRNAC
jgi:hypothetical protein